MKPPRIVDVTALKPGVLEICWTTGETLTANINDWIERFQILAPLRQASIFAKARVGWYGHSIEWAEDIDLGADQLYERCREQAGLATPQIFNAWMQRHQLSTPSAAEVLGISERTVAQYRIGAKPLPRQTWLACLGWEATNHASHVPSLTRSTAGDDHTVL